MKGPGSQGQNVFLQLKGTLHEANVPFLVQMKGRGEPDCSAVAPIAQMSWARVRSQSRLSFDARFRARIPHRRLLCAWTPLRAASDGCDVVDYRMGFGVAYTSMQVHLERRWSMSMDPEEDHSASWIRGEQMVDGSSM